MATKKQSIAKMDVKNIMIPPTPGISWAKKRFVRFRPTAAKNHIKARLARQTAFEVCRPLGCCVTEAAADCGGAVDTSA